MNKAGCELEAILNSIYVLYHNYLYMSSAICYVWGACLPPGLAQPLMILVMSSVLMA